MDNSTEHPLQRYRRRHGLTQGALAARLDCSIPMVSAIEGGKRRVLGNKAIDWETRLGGEVTRHELRPDLYPAHDGQDRRAGEAAA